MESGFPNRCQPHTCGIMGHRLSAVVWPCLVDTWRHIWKRRLEVDKQQDPACMKMPDGCAKLHAQKRPPSPHLHRWRRFCFDASSNPRYRYSSAPAELAVLEGFPKRSGMMETQMDPTMENGRKNLRHGEGLW